MGKNTLKTKRISIVPTMRCTLNCKLCSNHMTEFRNPESATANETKRDIDRLFELFGHIEWLQFVGGEIFLHQDLAEIISYCEKHRAQFDRLILETNATLMPRPEVVDALAKYGENAQVMISDYGELSKKRCELTQALTDNKIPYLLKNYYGDDQHFGGWIDNTGRKDYGESETVVAEKAAGCAQVRIENMHCWRGKLHRCSNSLFLYELGLFEANPRDYLDMTDDSQSLAAMREIVADFYKSPRKSCEFCSWKDGDSTKRFPAAEQMVRSIANEAL